MGQLLSIPLLIGGIALILWARLHRDGREAAQRRAASG
jgi:prolipoprotein diacylglyceryltransferase